MTINGPLVASIFAAAIVALASPMETPLVIGLLCVGAVLGGLIVAAWKSDRETLSDPTEHGGTPL